MALYPDIPLSFLTWTESGGEVTITDCDTSLGGAYSIPAEIEGDAVTDIGAQAFAYCNKITKIKTPNTITKIGENSFFNCTEMESIILNEGITQFSTETFRNCGLKKVVFPNTVGLGLSDNRIFENCAALETVVFGAGVTGDFGASMFLNCAKLKNVVFGKNMTTIPYEMFRDCSNLEHIIIPHNITAISTRAFLRCVKLKTVIILNPETTIHRVHLQGNAFQLCPPTLTFKGWAGSTTEIYAADPAVPSQFPTTEPFQFSALTESISVNRLSIYDSRETDFSHNGLHILAATAATTAEELNGGYELTLQHPCDTDGRWKMLLEMNIIKSRGQLYRIYNKTKSMGADGSKNIAINAEHIFYDLNNPLLIDVRPTGKTGQEAIDYIIENMYEGGSGGTLKLEFSGTSDIEDVDTAYYVNISPVKALLGADNAFINRWGGELKRDNFQFSINQNRGITNAFNIKYGADMTEIEETTDYSNMITWLSAVDNFGNQFAVSYNDILIPHHKVARLVFNYDTNDYENFKRDVQDYFDTVYVADINFRVSFANLKNDPMYAGFIDLQRCELGDTGMISHEPLGIETTQKIIKKTVDELTGDVISIELGAVKRSIVRQLKYSNVLPADSPQLKLNAALQQQIRALSKTSFGTHAQLANFTHAELALFTHKQLGGDG